MQECFCGCGRKTSFSDRGINKQGRRTVGVIRDARAVREKLARHPEADGDLASTIRFLDDVIANGEGYEAFWVLCIHEGAVPANVLDTMRLKREWVHWGKHARKPLALMRDAPADDVVRWLRASEADEQGEA